MIYNGQDVTDLSSDGKEIVDVNLGQLSNGLHKLKLSVRVEPFYGETEEITFYIMNNSQLNIIEKLANSDIPICAHIGLRPQSVNKMGGYKVQGKSSSEAKILIQEAKKIEESGADLLLLECVSAQTARELAKIKCRLCFLPK